MNSLNKHNIPRRVTFGFTNCSPLPSPSHRVFSFSSLHDKLWQSTAEPTGMLCLRHQHYHQLLPPYPLMRKPFKGLHVLYFGIFFSQSKFLRTSVLYFSSQPLSLFQIPTLQRSFYSLLKFDHSE